MIETLVFLDDFDGRRAIFRVPTREGINWGSKTCDIYWHQRFVGGMMNLTGDICSQNYIWVNHFMDQGFKMRVICVHWLWPVEVSVMCVWMGGREIWEKCEEKHYRQDVEVLLQGRLILLRHRVRTSSLISVIQRDDPDKGAFAEGHCKLATMIARKPTPEPNSRTRFDVTNSTRRNQCWGLAQDKIVNKYLDGEW